MGKTKTLSVALIQLNSTKNKQQNLAQTEKLINEACQSCQPQLIVLPEMFNFMGGTAAEKMAAAETINDESVTVNFLKELAKKNKIYIHAGSITEFDNDHYYNTTIVLNPNGEIICLYRKINLFNFLGSDAQYNEAALLSPGKEIKSYFIDDIKFGCAICFDLRFPNLFQQLNEQDVDVIVLPSAFTYETGKAHWEILCRARAIETQSFFIAPAQTGNHEVNDQERACFGHSLIIDPWGKVLSKMADEVGYCYAILNSNDLQVVRRKMSLR